MSEGKMDLNQAGIDELATLPGIGEKLAVKIVEHRNDGESFSELADLAAVPGISDQMVTELEDHLAVQETRAESVPVPVAKKQAKIEKAGKKSPPPKDQEISEDQLWELRMAARSGDLKKVRTLLKNSPNRVDKFALIWAAQNGHDQIVAELIEAGADVKSVTAAGGTNALDLAAQNGHLEIVQMLIRSGANVNKRAMEGWTPLMKAAFFGHKAIVETLLAAGAATGSRDVNGQTAIGHAQRADNQGVMILLSS